MAAEIDDQTLCRKIYPVTFWLFLYIPFS